MTLIVTGMAVAGAIQLANASNYRFLSDSAVVSDFNDTDMTMLLDTVQAALDQNKPLTWKNTETGNEGTVTPGQPATYQDLECRYTELFNKSNTRQATTHYKFCKTADGTWKIAPGD